MVVVIMLIITIASVFLWCGSIKYRIVLCTYKREFILCFKVHVFKVIATSCSAPVKQSIIVWLAVTFFPSALWRLPYKNGLVL